METKKNKTMKNLISMTDFVLKQIKSKSNYKIEKIDNYANFLKQPLELWMFIPCDLIQGKIVILNEENNHYQQAKERCLFEGFELKTYNTDEYDNIESVVKYNHCYVGIKYKNENSIRLNDISKQETIEHLIPNELILTETALKQIGL
jgi:hypothetical protein